MRVPYSELYGELRRVLLKMEFTPDRADLSAKLFAESSRDGVYSHGLNRFPSYMDHIQKGYIDVNAVPERVQAMGVLERWDGHRGPGNINAYLSMERAIQLSQVNGMGCVALKNTNHWMRAGSYGWQAAEAGCIGICWTNTMPNMPPWGAKECKIGNNPIVFAIPRDHGHVVLDTAMSQFSYGQLHTYNSRGEMLPVPGGFDVSGQFSQEPSQILESGRVLPIGYWKGSGLSIVLDMIAMLLSGGRSTYEVGADEGEQAISQVFISFNLELLPEHDLLKCKMERIIEDLHSSLPAEENGAIRYPGEETLRRREDNLLHGVPVDPHIWRSILEI